MNKELLKEKEKISMEIIMKKRLIGYYEYKGKNPRNKKYPIHVIYAIKEWSESSLKIRGLLGNRKLLREATKNEIKIMNKSKRCISYAYEYLEDLIADEIKEGSSKEFICQLIDKFKYYSKDRFELFQKYKPEELKKILEKKLS